MFASIYYVDIQPQPTWELASYIDYFYTDAGAYNLLYILCDQVIMQRESILGDLHEVHGCGICVVIDCVLLCKAQSAT